MSFDAQNLHDYETTEPPPEEYVECYQCDHECSCNIPTPMRPPKEPQVEIDVHGEHDQLVPI